jgi:hypothetical protein
MCTNPSAPSPLPTRWALILVSALVAALFVGALTFMQTVSWPAALLAAFAAAGTTVPTLHQILGK